MIQRIDIDRSYIFCPAIYVVLRAEITGCKNILQLKKAIASAVKKFEILNCKIVQDEKGECYYVQKDNFTKPYIEVTDFIQDAQEFMNEQERIEFNLEKGELVRFIISTDGNKLVLSIVQHHLAGDGKSCLLLLQEILIKLEIINSGKVIDDSNETVVPINLFTKEYLSRFVEMNELEKAAVKKLNKSCRGVDKGVDKAVYTLQDLHELFQDYWKSHKTKVITRTLSVDIVSQLSEICRKKGVTVNNAIATAIIKSLDQYRKSKICIVVDLRTKRQIGLGNYANVVSIERIYDYTRDFWGNVNNIQTILSSYLADRTKLFSGLLFQAGMNNSIIDGRYFDYVYQMNSSIVKQYNELVGIGEDGVPLVISNLGKSTIKETYGNIKLEGLSFFSPLSPGYNANLSIITASGKMVLNLQYNETDVDYEKVFDELVAQLNFAIQSF